jgi:glutamate carboxypeptidase
MASMEPPRSARPHHGRPDAMRAQTPAMLDHLAALVSVETPSEDLAACAAGTVAVSELAAAIIQEPGERLEADGRPHLRWAWPTRAWNPKMAPTPSSSYAT